jgi:hypothetical protein
MASNSKTTTDHDTIRRWAEARGGQPMAVAGTESGDSEMIRIGFPDAPGSDDSDLERISWDEWFEQFEDNDLALLYQETTDGEQSNFNKLVSRSG